jgi:DNA-binding transcriptional MerR regulator
MMLTVGELARRCGLTVRSLHHYDAIGLLVPASRSDAGYRLYARADIERLHRIQALRQLGLSLTAIGTALSGSQQPLAEVVDRQIAQIDHELHEGKQLRARLILLRTQLTDGQSPVLADWLETLELMTMYEKYFSPEELKTLPMHNDQDLQDEWAALITTMQAALDRGATPEDVDTQILALRWMEMLGRGTGNNAAFVTRLRVMNDSEPGMRERTGIAPQMMQLVEKAMANARLTIFARYLDEDEMTRMRANYGKQGYAWPELIAELSKLKAAGTPARDPRVQQLAKRWMELFREYAGDDQATHARIREAYAKEPDLRSASAVDHSLLFYVRESIESGEPKSD